MKKPFDAAFAKILTHNTVLEGISKQANCWSRQFTGWCGSALSYKQHLQFYLEREIKPQFFMSKYTKSSFFLKTITRLKLTSVGLDTVLKPSFTCAACLQERAPRHSQSLSRALMLRVTVLEKKAPCWLYQSSKQTRTAGFLIQFYLKHLQETQDEIPALAPKNVGDFSKARNSRH